MEYRYQEEKLDHVFDYFVGDYKYKDKHILSHDAFVDLVKRIVVFKLLVEDDKPEASQ